MHDIALPLMAQSEPDKLTDVFTKAQDGASFSDLEFEAFGFDHAQLGSRLAVKWQLAEGLAAVIRFHHAPDSAPDNFKPLCRCVFVADTLCGRAAVGCPLTSISQDLSDDDFNSISLTREAAEPIVAKLPLLLRLYLSF
jgi:HD-like signal output (HDOD) protein